MKNFMHKKWLGIPVVGIIAVLLALSVVGGIMAYTTLTATSNIAVNEPITISCTGGDGSYTQTGSIGTWTVSMYAGESRTLDLQITNAANAAVPVTVTESDNGGGNVTMTSTQGGLINFLGAGAVSDIFTINASPSATPSTGYVFTLTFSR
jgi:uncharacterized membrane protein